MCVYIFAEAERKTIFICGVKHTTKQTDKKEVFRGRDFVVSNNTFIFEINVNCIDKTKTCLAFAGKKTNYAKCGDVKTISLCEENILHSVRLHVSCEAMFIHRNVFYASM